MRFERSLRRVFCEPWLILPTMHQTISSVLQQHIAGNPVDFAEELMGDQPAMHIRDGVAVVPVRGVISKDISKMERMSGAVDVREIGEMLEIAAQDPSVSAILLDIDSPGGTVQGVPELAGRIAEVNTTIKPVVSYTDGLMASAAYWLGSSAEAVYASESATVGSIGVYIAMLDQSRAYELAGYKMDVIKSEQSPLKAAGLPGTTLSEAQRADLQASVDYLYSKFSNHVKAQMNGIKPEAMQGQTFFGEQAAEMGLVSEIVGFEGALKSAVSLGNSAKNKRN